MSTAEITFETKCYEKDWRIILTTGWLEEMIGQNLYDFKERILHINNVSDTKLVAQHAERLVAKGILTSYSIVADYEKQVLDFFGLREEDFKGGYYYSIAELVAIHNCKTEYLLHYAGDCKLAAPLDWIGPSLNIFRQHPNVKVFNPVWNGDVDEAEEVAFAESKDFYWGYGFSDQCYLIRVEDFKKRIYEETHPASQRYPAYGGELFEKRVDAWMRTYGYYRLTYKHGSYIHHWDMVKEE
jgi:hypothetical protein